MKTTAAQVRRSASKRKDPWYRRWRPLAELTATDASSGAAVVDSLATAGGPTVGGPSRALVAGAELAAAKASAGAVVVDSLATAGGPTVEGPSKVLVAGAELGAAEASAGAVVVDSLATAGRR